MSSPSKIALLITLPLALPGTAFAQRTSENAVTQSSDAFGRSVGNERTGLYSTEDVRGFNPVDAGNARLEGLYFDQLDRLPPRLSEGNTIRVGISAQHYPFPAPTGLVDHILTKPGKELAASLVLERGPYGGFAGALEAEVPITDTFGVSGGVGWREQYRPEGGHNRFRNAGTTIAWRPYQGAELLAFAGFFRNVDEEARPTLFPATTELPPRLKRGQFLGQDWADRHFVSSLYGTIAKLPIGAFRLEAGLFQAKRTTDTVFADLLTGVRPDGSVARRTIIADGNNQDRARSGEVRLVRAFTTGDVEHSFTASLRGRKRDRLFGGTQAILLGPSFADRPDPRPQPAIALGPENTDRARQFTYGLAYSGVWARRGSIDASLSKSRYRKTVDFADPLLPTVVTLDRPLLWNIGASVHAAKRLAFYGGLARGQEEALVAPDIATNRAEAPPAIRTKQIDAGLRYALTDKLTLVAGLFSVKKPYFNLDATRRYRQLGIVDNRGVELSLAGQLQPGLTIIAGTVLTDPKIGGQKALPVGQTKRRSILNLDWRTGKGKGPLSLDLALESVSSRAGNLNNSFFAPPRETVNIGARYRFQVQTAKLLIRPQVTNLFNDYGWQVSSSGGFTYSSGRTWTLQMVTDF